MKRLLIVLIIAAAFLAGCSSKKISYTKEIPILPSLNNMKFSDLTPSQNSNLTIATYKIENAKKTDTISSYEALLKKDGWKILSRTDSGGLEAAKKNYKVIITPVQDNKDLWLVIVADKSYKSSSQMLKELSPNLGIS